MMILNIIRIILFIYTFSTKIINTKLNEWKININNVNERFRRENEEKLRIKEKNERLQFLRFLEDLRNCENVEDIYNYFYVRDLRFLCKHLNLQVSGNKTELSNKLFNIIKPNTKHMIVPTQRQDFFKDTNCPICYDTQYKMVAMVPCGHTYCMSCANKISKCPVCKNTRASKVKYVELYVQ